MVHGKVNFISVAADGDTYVILEVHSVVYYRETGQFKRLSGGALITTTDEDGTVTSCQIQD